LQAQHVEQSQVEQQHEQPHVSVQHGVHVGVSHEEHGAHELQGAQELHGSQYEHEEHGL
jgi:hypothetical protein